MGSLHSGAETGEATVQAAQAVSETTESIGHKCRVLNEKLDQLLSTLHEETATPQGGQQSSSPRTSIDEGDQHNPLQEADQMDEQAIAKSSTSTKEAKESRNESRAVRQKGVRKVRLLSLLFFIAVC